MAKFYPWEKGKDLPKPSSYREERRAYMQKWRDEHREQYTAARREQRRRDREAHYEKRIAYERAYREKRRLERLASGEQAPPRYHTPEHGTLSRYTNHGCRCTACYEAMSAHRKAYYRRKMGLPEDYPGRQRRRIVELAPPDDGLLTSFTISLPG